VFHSLEDNIRTGTIWLKEGTLLGTFWKDGCLKLGISDIVLPIAQLDNVPKLVDDNWSLVADELALEFK